MSTEQDHHQTHDLSLRIVKIETKQEHAQTIVEAQALGISEVNMRVMRMEEWRLNQDTRFGEFSLSVDRRFTELVTSTDRRFGDLMATMEKHRADDETRREKEKEAADKRESDRTTANRWFIGILIPLSIFIMNFIDWIIKHSK